MMSTAGVDIAAGAARRRRERRLRSWLKHERMTVAMALAEASHHTAPRGQRTARAREWVRDEVHGHVPEAPTPSEPGTRYFSLDDNDSVRELGSLASGRRSESRGASWSRSSTQHPSFLFSTILILCRRWWTQWRKSVASSSNVGRWLPSKLGTVRTSWFSICPRFFSTWLRPAPLFLSRRRQNSWWQCPSSSGSSWHAAEAQVVCGAHVAHARARYWLGATASPGRYINTGHRAATYSSSLRWTVDGASLQFLDRVSLIMIGLFLLCRITLLSGRMVAFFLINLLVCSSSGSGFFAHQSEHCWRGRRWGDVDGMSIDSDVTSCRGFCSVPGPLQSVQRAEMWGVILALQSSPAVHLGVDNLGVVRHVGRLIDGCRGLVPFEFVNDGDLLLLIERILHLRGLDIVRISKVKGHADEDMVLHGRVRGEDKLGNDAADEAADFGRRRVSPAVIDARRNLSGVCGRWYPVILDLHRFFIAISRAVVNHDGREGTAPDPLVWSAGTLHKRRRLVHAFRDRAFLPGPPGIWESEWLHVPSSAVRADDVAHWPYSSGLLVKWVSFFGNLQWPVGGLDLGVGGSGISYVELVILYELWAGERLSLERAVPWYLRPGRPISVSAVPFGPGIDIWRSCHFIGSIMRSLCFFPGGLGRFVPCSIGANHCRLRHIGWERCGHGLTSLPLCPFLNELLRLFGYLSGSAGALPAGTLPLRYCTPRFAGRIPTWRLPVPGHAASLVTAGIEVPSTLGIEVSGREVRCVSGSGLVRKRIRLNRKPPAHLVGLGIQCRPRLWKRLCPVEISFSIVPDPERRCIDQDHADLVPAQIRTGVG